jgi:hypothetical protein
MAMDSDTLKGDRMKSLTLLWKAVADDFATWCCTSASRDFEELTRRFEHEGNSFLTITLPDFGKDFERSLSLGKVDPSLFAGWRKKGGLPLFLGGFLDQVFDRATAAISVNPNVEAIRAIRQLTLMFGKILLPTSEERTRNALIGYVNTEKEVRSMDARRGSLRDFRRVSRTLFGPLIASLDSDVRDFGLWPKHGPGKTADRISGNQKYDLRSWPTRLDAMFPFEEYCIYSPRHLAELDNEGLSLIDEVNFQLPGAELPVRVVCVPKTLKTPRIIAIEPTSMMYAQQAVSRSLVNYLETDDLVGGQIGFRDDHINQYLACVGSRDSSFATLDLSEASDRVSNQLVRVLFGAGYTSHAIQACRSQTADVLGLGKYRLSKFASMGSALTFPIEAMAFLCVIYLAIEKKEQQQTSPAMIHRWRRKVRVFGDDIIVPNDIATDVIKELEAYGFKVNSSKSFWTGMFRESCGAEYYAGEDVTISRVRRLLPTSRRDALEMLSCIALRNRLYNRGLWSAARWLDDWIGSMIRFYPAVLPTSPVVGRDSFLGYDTERTNADLHRPEVRGYVVSAPSPNSSLDGPPALLKCLLLLGQNQERSDIPCKDPDDSRFWEGRVETNHLERQGRPDAVYLKLRWNTPY